MNNSFNEIVPQRLQTKKATIVIVDDHSIIRDSLTQVLNNSALYNVVATSGTANEGIIEVQLHLPDILITDINMPGMNGIEAISLIRKASPGTKIIALTMHSQINIARKVIKLGASGYVTKTSPLEELLNAIREVNSGKKYLCAEIKNTLSEQLVSNKEEKNGVNSLSERELEIINLIKKGYSSKQISKCLGISAKTVEVHRYHILKRLKLANVAALVNYVNMNYVEY
ncbi:MAG: response regulator transcription factor [Bacteroidota bacterium]